MISVDTTFLVDLWRNKDDAGHPAVAFLEKREGETFMVPAHAAGEFLEGGASVSDRRLTESLRFLRLFAIAVVGLETARRYAEIVSLLRSRSLLAGVSKADLWIAASALEHDAALLTRNIKHFARVPDLRVIGY
jgi:predicted nucleic acid-binding protein